MKIMSVPEEARERRFLKLDEKCNAAQRIALRGWREKTGRISQTLLIPVLLSRLR